MYKKYVVLEIIFFICSRIDDFKVQKPHKEAYWGSKGLEMYSKATNILVKI